MRPQEEKLLTHKLKELGELYMDYATDDDTEARNVNMCYIENKIEDIILFVKKEIKDAANG
ncbi:protein of unknown function [Pseudotevenvirus RB43]|uniref:Uncharacterized protein n=1 Tax=Pseudotevenvirus RB43 TaxID=115991 RepID=K0NYT7_9CAUD|nr:hypothetical protein GuL6_144 [Buttiauxella phage vB_ButM_GuL6]CCK73991.1 protein of unknown function [Pseudotevenvirus RB43]CCL97608.1 protein of unknown function [Pseudotevenvirus RB43]